MARVQRQCQVRLQLWRCVCAHRAVVHMGGADVPHLAGGRPAHEPRRCKVATLGWVSAISRPSGAGCSSAAVGFWSSTVAVKPAFAKEMASDRPCWPGAHDEYVAVHVREGAPLAQKEQALWAGVCGRALQCIKGPGKTLWCRCAGSPANVTYVTQRDLTGEVFLPIHPSGVTKGDALHTVGERYERLQLPGWEVVWHGCMEQWAPF